MVSFLRSPSPCHSEPEAKNLLGVESQGRGEIVCGASIGARERIFCRACPKAYKKILRCAQDDRWELRMTGARDERVKA